ncbi:hypothetical protein [Streptomyces bullii]|uniref:Uncharacterized protein n=1 Tax=Streptomyces bullii TaxID=349910 RepID=A0ABW0UIX3_9ACTN
MTTILAAAYRDVLLRDSFLDTGQTPTTGDICQSPDIIPYGDDFLSFDRLESTYETGPDLGRPVTSGQNNNFYIRAKNYKGSATSGKVRLWVAPASLLLTPNQWKILYAPGHQVWVPLVNRNDGQQIQSRQIARSKVAFTWGGDPSGAHHCSVAVVDTPDHPAENIPDHFDSNGEFAYWVANSPWVAWRNLVIISAGQYFRTQDVGIGNLDSTPSQFFFKVEARGIPVGQNNDNEIQLECTDPRATFKVKTDVPPPDPHTGLQQTVLGPVTLPARFAGQAQLSVTTHQPLDDDAYIVLSAYKLFDMADASEFERRLAIDAAELGAQVKGNAYRLGDCTFASEKDGLVTDLR